MTTLASLPTLRPGRSAEATVITEVTMLPPPMSTWISAATAPSLMAATLPAMTLRALISVSFVFR